MQCVAASATGGYDDATRSLIRDRFLTRNTNKNSDSNDDDDDNDSGVVLCDGCDPRLVMAAPPPPPPPSFSSSSSAAKPASSLDVELLQESSFSSSSSSPSSPSFSSEQSSSEPPLPVAVLPATVEHGLLVVPQHKMLEAVKRVLYTSPHGPTAAVVFVDDARRVEVVCEKLLALNVVAAPLHGDSSKVSKCVGRCVNQEESREKRCTGIL